jgi:nucleotide-binding universal stress UspA family protein
MLRRSRQNMTDKSQATRSNHAASHYPRIMQTTTARRSIKPALQLKKILVPIDFSLPSQQALDHARSFARSFGGEVILLHVVQRFGLAPFPEGAGQLDYTDPEFHEAQNTLKTLAHEIVEKTLKVQTLVRSGLAAHEIVEAATELDADLIVIATHGYTGWKHFCIGSTTERVVRTAPCPVFVVREKEHEFI